MVSKKIGSSCAMPVNYTFTSINFVGMCSRIFKIVFSSGSIFNRDKKSDAVFILPGKCANSPNYNTELQAFVERGGTIFVLKNLMTDLMSVMIITGLVAPQSICPNFMRAR